MSAVFSLLDARIVPKKLVHRNLLPGGTEICELSPATFTWQTEVADWHVQMKAGLGELHMGSSVTFAFNSEGFTVWIDLCIVFCSCKLLTEKKKKKTLQALYLG